MKTIEVRTNGIDFTYLEEGHGPLLLMVHGFPDDATTFNHQVGPLVDRGYRVVAPYMRGYAPTASAPGNVYQSAALATDLVGLIDDLGDGKATVLGHDWGAIAAYGAAVLAPEKIERLITMSVPHGPGVAAAMLTNYEQQKRSWYIFFFQQELADLVVANDDFVFIEKLWRDWSPDWDFSKEAIAPVLATLAKPGVLANALGYYRAFFDTAYQDPALAAEQARVGNDSVNVPTLYLHGRNDGCMGVEVSDGMEAVFPAGLKKVVVEGVGHFLHREKPEEVNRHILDWLDG